MDSIELVENRVKELEKLLQLTSVTRGMMIMARITEAKHILELLKAKR